MFRCTAPLLVHVLAVSRFCVAVLLLVSVTTFARAEDWPQWRGPGRDGVWNEKNVVEKFESQQIPIRWRAEISSGYSGPTVAKGRVYVTDRVIDPKQFERVHCFDADNGKPLWQFDYDCFYKGVGYEAGPRASVSIDSGKAYSLGSMGHLHCLDAASGELIWKHDLNEEYNIEMPIWGIAASPLIEGDLVIVQIGGEPSACIVAFDKKTGTERWRALDDLASYSAPIMIQQGDQRVLVCWTGEQVVGLDPTSGKTLWQHPFKASRMVIAIATPVVEENRLLVSCFYDGSLMLRLDPDRPEVEKVWRRMGPNERETDSLHSIISTPYLEGDYIYGVDSYGEFRCLEAATGDRVWESLEPTPKRRWSTIHMVKNGDKIWMFNELGELIIARLSPKGYEEISRAQLIQPTVDQLNRRGEGVCWSHPAYANRHVFARNDKELVCASLAAE
jgi:outer membrane protein assembly factor BamB